MSFHLTHRQIEFAYYKTVYKLYQNLYYSLFYDIKSAKKRDNTNETLDITTEGGGEERKIRTKRKNQSPSELEKGGKCRCRHCTLNCRGYRSSPIILLIFINTEVLHVRLRYLLERTPFICKPTSALTHSHASYRNLSISIQNRYRKRCVRTQGLRPTANVVNAVFLDVFVSIKRDSIETMKKIRFATTDRAIVIFSPANKQIYKKKHNRFHAKFKRKAQ